MFKFIIFDFDGTLADTNAGIVSTFEATFQQLSLPIPSKRDISATIGLTLKDGFIRLLGENTDLADKAVSIYRELFPSIAFEIIDSFPNVTESLSLLHKEGIRMAVASSRSHMSLDYLAKKIGIYQFFEGIYACEDIVNPKPAPDMVNLIINKHNLVTDEILVVGDATFDLLMGLNAGCKVCGVTWGNQSRQELASVGPDYLIDSITELSKIIKNS